MTVIKYKCKECGKESWFDVNLLYYTVTIKDLMCDDCNPCEED